MKIFVTGITGFIGSNLWDFFAPSDEIIVLSRLPLQINRPGVKVLQGDMNDLGPVCDQLRKIRPDVCIHLAWEGIPDFSYERSFKNLQQSMSLLRCLVEECACQKIIVGGSCFEYGKSLGPCKENDEVETNSYFTWAKHALYDFGKLLSSKNLVKFIWFRFFYVYGPGQRSASLIPTLADTLMKGGTPAIKTPLNANDFVYVKDIAEALMMAAHKEIETGIYNLGTGLSVPVWKICETLESILQLTPQCSNEMKASPVKANADFWADSSKVSMKLGWNARTGLEQGLKQYILSVDKK